MSLLSGSFGRSITGGIRGFATGGVGGAIGGVLSGMLGRGGGAPSPARPFGNMPVPGPFGNTPYTGGIPTPGQVTGGSFFGKGTPTQCPRGYHLNKHPLAASKHHGHVAARSICVRNRSMNPMNYRALTRSLRRVKRASKIVRKLHHFNAPAARRRLSAPVAISENLRITSGK